MHRAKRLVLAHLWVAFALFAFAAVLGAWQMLVRSSLGAPLETPSVYYASVTLHGTAMAYVLTTFFAMGFGYFVAVTALDRDLPRLGAAWAGFWIAAVAALARDRRSLGAAWAGFWIAAVGTVTAVVPILLGKASVLYTFYPPLTGSVFYYLGVLLVVIGSWIWVALMGAAMVGWKREHPGRPVPLAMFATVA